MKEKFTEKRDIIIEEINETICPFRRITYNSTFINVNKIPTK